MDIKLVHDNFLSNWKGQTSAFAKQRNVYVDQFLKNDFPTKKIEEWHYTSLTHLKNTDWFPVGLEANEQPSHSELNEIRQLLNPDFTNIVFINNELNLTLSDIPFENGIVLKQSFDLSSADGSANKNLTAMESLNAAFTTKRLTLEISGEPEQTICITHYCRDGKSNLLNSPNMEILIKENTKVNLVEAYHSAAANGDISKTHLSNTFCKVNVEDNVKLNYIRLLDESESATHIGSNHFNIASNCKINFINLTLGGLLSRHNLLVNLNGKNSNCSLNGINVTTGKQHIDNYSEIIHNFGTNASEQLYKSILSDNSKSIFTGKVIIKRDAQKAQSSQLNNNLLLSENAEANSRPMLEILADDVKASHGSTVGEINAEEYFYLQSRGIAKQTAISMLSYAFAAEVIEKLYGGVSDQNEQVEITKLVNWMKKYLDINFSKIKEVLWKS